MTSPTTAQAGTPAYDIDAIRADFPILGRTMHDKPLTDRKSVV